MLDKLMLIDLDLKTPVILPNNGEYFVLQTCQRIIILGLDLKNFFALQTDRPFQEVYQGATAYQYLLETICGMKSKLLAENEIVAQFKTAYKNYLEYPDKKHYIIKILEKLFKDAKKIRTDFLKNIGQQSYSGITRKIINEKFCGGTILILGSGALGHDLIRFHIKKYKVLLSARNDSKVEELCQKFNITSIPWLQYETYEKIPYIVNTVGTNEVLFNQHFFNNWILQSPPHRIFVDLGLPSTVHTSFGAENGIIRLKDIQDRGTVFDQEKRKKILEAKNAIHALVKQRSIYFRSDFLVSLHNKHQTL